MLNELKILPTKLWFRGILFAIFYLLAAQISYAISFQGASFPTLWFPSGLFVAVLLLSPIKNWPAYLLAVLPANLAYGFIHGQPVPISLLIFISSALEAAAGAWFVRKFDEHAGELDTPTNVLYLIVISALISSAASALLNTTVQATLNSGLSFWNTWKIAWISRGLGILVIAPLILAWAHGRPRLNLQKHPERLIELAILTTGLLVCSLYIFLGPLSINKQSYMIVPFLVWVALRFGSRGITFSGLMVTLISAWGTVQRLDSFANTDITIAPNMASLGSFLGITMITCYILATIWDQGKRTENALRESEERYRLLIENQGEGVGIVTSDEVFVFANPAAAQIFGVDDLVGHHLKEFTDLTQYKTVLEQTKIRQTGKKTIYELEITQPGGKRCNLVVSATPEYDSQKNLTGTFAVFHDNTEQKRAEMALRDSRARFQILFDHTPIPVWEEDFSRIKLLVDGLRRDGVENFHEFFNQHPDQIDVCKQLLKVLDVNQAVLQVYGYTDKIQFLSHVSKLMLRGPKDIITAEIIAIAEGKTQFDMEGPNDLVDGVIRYHALRWTVAPGYEKDYRRVIVTIIDVTDRRQAEEHMRYLSTHDVLTGLYNRNFFEAELERLQNSRIEPINIMVVDINEMKSTNDTFGHAVGDELLRRTAQVLRMSFRKEDIIARMGGDEFVVLFHGSISIQEAVRRVKDCQAEHNHWYDGLPLSLAIGAASGGKGSLLVDLFKKADQQMYKEKLRSRKSRSAGKIDGKYDSKTGNSPTDN